MGSTNRRRLLGTIRARIVGGYVLLGLAGFVLTALIGRTALLSRFDADVDEILAGEIEQLTSFANGGDLETGEPYTDLSKLFEDFLGQVLPPDDGAFFTLVDGDPFKLSFDAPANLFGEDELVDRWRAVETSTFDSASSDAGTVRLLVVPVSVGDDEGTFVAAEFTDDGRSRVLEVFTTLLVVAAGVLVAAGFVGALIAGRITAPVRDFRRVATRVSDDDLTARVSTDEGPDEIRDLARAFNSMLDRLETAFASQRRLLDDVAHELRTPITIVRGHLEVYDTDLDRGAEGGGPSESRAADAPDVGLLIDELDRMNRYVDDLLVLAQAERPDFLQLESIDLADLSESIVARSIGLADRAWRLDVVERRGRTVRVDPQRILQAVLNLVQNAIRHTIAGDEVAITVECDDDEVRLAVRDTGTGIDPEVADRLFERHVRSVASRAEGGSGLGLSIVDAIAVAHGGSVRAAPGRDRGSEFEIRLPVVVVS
ncbi:MAG: ATP-binding protein [Actinomycetota bacterium]